MRIMFRSVDRRPGGRVGGDPAAGPGRPGRRSCRRYGSARHALRLALSPFTSRYTPFLLSPSTLHALRLALRALPRYTPFAPRYTPFALRYMRFASRYTPFA